MERSSSKNSKTKEYNDQVVNTPSPKFRLTRERGGGGGSILHVVTRVRGPRWERRREERDGFFLRSSASFLKDDDGKRRAEQSSWRRLNKSHYKLASCWLSSSTKLTNSLYIKTNRPPRHPPGRAPRLI